jgi:hypothetical protein
MHSFHKQKDSYPAIHAKFGMPIIFIKVLQHFWEHTVALYCWVSGFAWIQQYFK